MKVLNKEIDVIAKFDIKGIPTPIKFRIMNEDESYSEIKIDHVKSKNIEKFAGNKMWVFDCQSFLNSQMKLYQIKYELDTCLWYLFKM